jgi:anti-sigma-K factor RskA
MTVDIHALAGAYALNALDDVERAAFVRHMRECEACAQEVAEYLETTGRMADLSATPTPQRLRDSVLAEIARARQLPPAATSGSRRVSAQSRPKRWLGAVAAGVVIAAGAAGATYAIQDHRVRVAQSQASQNAEIQRVLAAPDARVEDRGFAGGRLVAVTSLSLNEGVVVLKDLRSPGDKAYQLWMMYPDHNTSMGVLAAGAVGGLRLITGLHGADSFGLSEEPPGGSARPSNVVDTLSM